jgi:uncharacterized membrane protein
MDQGERSPHQNPEWNEKALRRLEARIARIEAYLQIGPFPEADEASESGDGTAAPFAADLKSEATKEAAWELKIGEFWLARVGMVALLLGTAFFIS